MAGPVDGLPVLDEKSVRMNGAENKLLLMSQCGEYPILLNRLWTAFRDELQICRLRYV